MTTIESKSAIESFVSAAEEKDREAQAAESSRWRVFWLLCLLVPVPLMVPYLIELWQVDWYRYYPFVFLSVGFMVHQRWDRKFAPPGSWFAWAAVAFGLLSVVLGGAALYPWFAALGFVTIAITCLSCLSGRDDRSLLGVGIPLLLLVRPPFRSDQVFVAELQRVTTWMSSVFLDFLAVPHTAVGNVMRLADRELFVAEACSGVQSVFTLAFCACLIVAWNRIRLWLFPFYMLAALLLALAANTIRVTSIAVADSWFDTDLSSGWNHDLLGYTCLAIAIALLFSFDQLIAILFHHIDVPSGRVDNPVLAFWGHIALAKKVDGERRSSSSLRPRSSSSRSSRRIRFDSIPSPVQWGFAACLSAILLFSLGQVLRSQRRQTVDAGSKELLFATPAQLFSGFQGSFTLTAHQTSRGGADPRLGANADIWDFESEDLRAQVLLSQPYSGWKELCVCYEGGEWNLVDRSVGRPPIDDIGGPLGSYAIGRFKGELDDEMNGYLFFSAIRPDGTVLPAPTRLGSLGTRFKHRFDYAGVWKLDDVMMLQMWVVSRKKLTPDAIANLESEFVSVRAVVLSAVRAASSAPKSNSPRTEDTAALPRETM